MNKKRILGFVLTAAMVLSALTGCSGNGNDSGNNANNGGSKGGKTLVVRDGAWEGTDVFQVSWWTDMQCLIADTILEKDPETGDAVPGIASEQKWSDDGLTWTLTFPEGMYYSTGEQVEPEDFIASVEYGLKVSPYSDGYKCIESMEVDGRDVIVHLSEYQADMLYNFQTSFIALIDKDEIDKLSADDMLWGCHPYGAYYVDDYQPGAYAILKANEKYKTNNPKLKNQGAAPIKDIKVVFTGEDFTQAQGIQNGDFDVLASVPAEYYDELKKSDSVEVVEASGAEVHYTELNMTDPLFQDINVRKAIIHAISRDNLGIYLSVFEKPAYSLVVSKCLNYSDDAVDYYKQNYGYDAELSKKLLADAGWTDTNNDGFVDKNGQKFTFEFDCRDDEVAKKAAQSIQIDLKAVGIDMQIKTQNWSYVNQDVVDGNFQMAYLGLGWGEPFLLMDNFCNRNPEVTNPDPENYNAMVAAARKTLDYDERTEQITELQKKLFDYATIIPLIDNEGFRCWRSEIKGIVHTQTGGFYLGDVVADADGNFRNVQ